LYTNAFQHTKNKGNLFSEVKVIGPLLAGLPLKFNIASMKFLFNSLSYCIHKRTVNVKYSQINSFSLLFVKSPDFLSLEKKISRFFTLSGWQVWKLYYCEQNASSRINTESEALVCLNLDVMMCRIKSVKRWVNSYVI
jgi:hypothetical protein